MALDSYLQFDTALADEVLEKADLSFLPDTTRILSRKLEVLTVLSVERLQIQSRNISAIDSNRESVQETIQRLDAAARYNLRKHQDKGAFYKRLFDLETERRSESVECWRDIVMVMRDLLWTWDYREQAKSRAIFLDDVRR